MKTLRYEVTDRVARITAQKMTVVGQMQRVRVRVEEEATWGHVLDGLDAIRGNGASILFPNVTLYLE